MFVCLLSSLSTYRPLYDPVSPAHLPLISRLESRDEKSISRLYCVWLFITNFYTPISPFRSLLTFSLNMTYESCHYIASVYVNSLHWSIFFYHDYESYNIYRIRKHYSFYVFFPLVNRKKKTWSNGLFHRVQTLCTVVQLLKMFETGNQTNRRLKINGKWVERLAGVLANQRWKTLDD